MNSDPKKDLSRLPRWAQQEIARLRGNVAHWKKLAISATIQGASNVHLHEAEAGGGVGPGLPKDSGVVFILPGIPTVPLDGLSVSHWPDQRIEVRHELSDGLLTRLNVYCSTGRLIVRPASSNVLYLEGDPRS